jgi:multisubunit Na+/H+ antiporter MnhB subunit
VPSWGAVAYGVALSAILAVVAMRFLLRERRPWTLAAAGIAAGVAPLLWDLILRHTGGRFFTDAPGLVFPVSYEDTGSGVFATALAVLVLGFGPMRSDKGRRLASAAAVCGLAALLVDIYLY